MENEVRKMIDQSIMESRTYTTDEKYLLVAVALRMHPDKYDGSDPLKATQVSLSVSKRMFRTTVHTLLKILEGDLEIYEILDEDYKRMFRFIHYIPLIKVPLYINEFPEAASWRMGIGK